MMSLLWCFALCCLLSLTEVNGYATSTVPDESIRCQDLRCNYGPGNPFNHGVEDDVSTDSGNYGIDVVITETNISTGLDRHNFFEVTIKLQNPETSPGFIGWMVQVRDNGSSNALPAAVSNGTVRGLVGTYGSDWSLPWTCPRRFVEIPQEIPEVANGLKWRDSSIIIAPNAPKITEFTFTWAPVIKNGTNADNSINYVSDIPKCGKVIYSMMFNQKRDGAPADDPKYTWVHVRESSCFITYTQDATPIPCSFDQDCV